MSQHAYYTLIASLPYLPRFDQSERLPISAKRLAERLQMLSSEDAAVVKRGIEFLAWRQHPTERTDREMVARYQHMMELVTHPALKKLMAFIIDQRTIVVALRRRQLGLPVPVAGEPWGVGQWVGYIEQHWDDETFQLGRIHRWIPQAKTYLEQGETLRLERLQLNLIWDHVDRSTQDNGFGFESVLAYLFKWNIVREWLCHNPAAAQARFADLVAEVLHEHQQLFN